jgi:hypothetical protein
LAAALGLCGRIRPAEWATRRCARNSGPIERVCRHSSVDSTAAQGAVTEQESGDRLPRVRAGSLRTPLPARSTPVTTMALGLPPR